MKKKFFLQLLPWVITTLALYYAFRGIHFTTLAQHVQEASPLWVLVAILLTSASYLLRSRRWQLLLPHPKLSFQVSFRVLILGFFMNNILPARTGELVRAHFGSRATGETRTLVLASIAAERLADGLMLSAFFVAFSVALPEGPISQNLFYVALFFAAAAVAVVSLLLVRAKVFTFVDKVQRKINSKTTQYTSNRLQTFITGLLPLCSRKRFPLLFSWSILVWTVELAVFASVSIAYGADLSVSELVFFMVTVNFSSLIPAAPGGIGVIEAVASGVLISLGVAPELALAMVLTQHSIQFLVVGLPGLFYMLLSRKHLTQIKEIDATANT